MGRERIINSAEEMQLFGAECSAWLTGILALQGDLGAGKTTFVQGLLRGLGITEMVQSPTFTYLQTYEDVHHFDLYRLSSHRDFTLLGFEEYLYAGRLAVIEWPERIAPLLPADAWQIQLCHVPEGRMATIGKWGDST